MNFLATNIKFLRQNNNLTQDDIGKVVNKSRVLVSWWEANEREISIEDIIKLSDYFNLPMDILVGKDLRIKDSPPTSRTEILFNKTKDILNDDERAMIEATMERAIKKYEEMKNKGV